VGSSDLIASSKEEIDDLEWRPDGTQIVFGARAREEERYGKEKVKDQPPRRITRLFFRLDSVGWTVDRPRHLFVVPSDASAKPRALTSGPFGYNGLSISPDGAWVAASSSQHDTWDLDRCVDLWRIPIAGGEPEQLTETETSYARPSFSPTGDEIAFGVGNPKISPSHSQVGVLELRTEDVSVLTRTLDRQCAPFSGGREPVWHDDHLYFLVEDCGNVALYRVAADPDGERKPELVVDGDRVITGFDIADGVLAFSAGSATALTEIFVVRPEEDERALTRHGAGFAAELDVREPERFLAPSTGGVEVEAWVIRPAGIKAGKKYPTLLNIHGGPFTQYANKLFDEFQVQAGAGYAVVYCNPRGSSGYSEAWGRAIRGPHGEAPGTGWGSVDYDDVMAVMDEAIKRFDFIDAGRLGVLGGSYGGYMTTWIVSHTDRFKAAISERAANNLLTLEQSSDIATAFHSYMGATHLDDPDLYIRMSPTTYVGDIDTPLMILHSEDDLRCPVHQAEELFTALRVRQRDVEMVRFPGESHELSRSGAPKHRIQRMEIVLEFFDRHLKSKK
jgi:dipeptidyl aminopeptidase/acylaminoacyl peptidase